MVGTIQLPFQVASSFCYVLPTSAPSATEKKSLRSQLVFYFLLLSHTKLLECICVSIFPQKIYACTYTYIYLLYFFLQKIFNREIYYEICKKTVGKYPNISTIGILYQSPLPVSVLLPVHMIHQCPIYIYTIRSNFFFLSFWRFFPKEASDSWIYGKLFLPETTTTVYRHMKLTVVARQVFFCLGLPLLLLMRCYHYYSYCLHCADMIWAIILSCFLYYLHARHFTFWIDMSVDNFSCSNCFFYAIYHYKHLNSFYCISPECILSFILSPPLSVI